jgi:hypothetical protein
VGYNDSATRPPFRFLLPASLLALTLLSGRLRTEVSIDVTSLEKADVSLVVAVDVEALSSFASTFGDAKDAAALEEMSGEEILSEVGDGQDTCSEAIAGLNFSVSPYEEGVYKGVICTAQDADTAQVMSTLFGDSSALREGEIRGTWVLEGRLVDALSFGSEADDFDEGGLDMGGMFDPADFLELRISVSAPGQVQDSNGTVVEGSRVTWLVAADARFMEGSDAVLRAVWEIGARGVSDDHRCVADRSSTSGNPQVDTQST